MRPLREFQERFLSSEFPESDLGHQETTAHVCRSIFSRLALVKSYRLKTGCPIRIQIEGTEIMKVLTKSLGLAIDDNIR